MTNIDEVFNNYETDNVSDKEKFEINTIERANWALKKILSVEAKKDEVKQFTKNKIDQVKNFEKQQIEELDRSVEYIKYLLTQYANESLKDEKRKKSIKLLDGVVGFRTKAVSFEMDDKKLLEFVKQYDESFINTTETVNWSDFKNKIKVVETKQDDNTEYQAVTEDGEVIECIKVNPAYEEFYTKGGENK